MNRLLRTAVLTPLAALPLLLGPALTAHAAPAAPPSASATAFITATATATVGDDQYEKGFKKGFQAVKADCGAKPPNDLRELDPDYQKGYEAGAALAAKTFCGGE